MVGEKRGKPKEKVHELCVVKQERRQWKGVEKNKKSLFYRKVVKKKREYRCNWKDR